MNALVAGYTAALMKAFDGLGGYSDIQLFPGQLIWQAVVMTVDFDVIIYIDPGLLPLGILVRALGQWLQGRLLGLVVQLFQKLGHGLVQLGQREKGPFSQSGQNPALDQ